MLDFAFKPLRIRTVPIPGKGRRQVHYLYYKVVNRTGKPRMFVPQFIMVNEKRAEVRGRGHPRGHPAHPAPRGATIPLLGAVDIIGMIPPSTKPNVDDAVFGVASWDTGTPSPTASASTSAACPTATRRFPAESGGKPVAKYKTLRIDFIRRGDERNLNEKEIQLADPPYEWVYW